MKRNGFTITELLVVIAIMSILMGIAGLAYSTWRNKYQLERQVREMYVDLMNGRVQAMQKNIAYFVVVAADGYSYRLVEDKNDNGVLNPDPDDTTRLTKQLKYSSTWTNTATMNSRGLVSPNDTILFNTGGVDAAFDCITLFTTRIRMGKWNGTDCNPM